MNNVYFVTMMCTMDTVLYKIENVGSRYGTYPWTTKGRGDDVSFCSKLTYNVLCSFSFPSTYTAKSKTRGVKVNDDCIIKLNELFSSCTYRILYMGVRDESDGASHVIGEKKYR